VSKTNNSFAQSLLAYPNASAAKHTLIGVINEKRTARIYGQLRQDFHEPFCFELHVEMLGYFLKFTRAIFETMGAIHRVASQEQFQSGVG
jgi:hypothetical protein